MSILIIQPVRLDPPGEIASALETAGENYQIIQIEDGERLPEKIDVYDGIIIMGGTMGAEDVEDYPFLSEVKAMICQFHDENKPLLGICLGAQLIASALGKPVGRMEKPEFGITALQKTEHGKTDPLFRKLPASFSFMEWHKDRFDLPDGAVLLATGKACKNQAFRIKDAIYGFQFHPEINETILNSWLETEGERILTQDAHFLGKLEHTVKPALLEAQPLCREMVTEWVYLLRKNRTSRNNAGGVQE